MPSFAGVITAMVTPFDEDGEVDLPACRRLAVHLLADGSDGLVLCGTTGESPTLDDAEKLAILREVREELGSEAHARSSGSGSNDTRHSVELTRRVAEAGADAALVVTPYYNKPNPAGVRAHFEACAAAAELPLVDLQHPLPLRDQHPAARSGGACEDRQRGRGQAGQRRRARSDRGTRRARGQRQHAAPLPARAAAPAASSSPRTWSAPQMREICDAVAAGELDRARRARRGPAADLRGDRRDQQPDPGEDGAGDARRLLGSDAPADGPRRSRSSARRSAPRSTDMG